MKKGEAKGLVAVGAFIALVIVWQVWASSEHATYGGTNEQQPCTQALAQNC